MLQSIYSWLANTSIDNTSDKKKNIIYQENIACQTTMVVTIHPLLVKEATVKMNQLVCSLNNNVTKIQPNAPNLVTIYKWWCNDDGKYVTVITSTKDTCDNLVYWLTHNQYSFHDLLLIICQILHCLIFLDSLHIVHNQLTLEHIFVNGGNIKVDEPGLFLTITHTSNLDAFISLYKDIQTHTKIKINVNIDHCLTLKDVLRVFTMRRKRCLLGKL